MEHLQRLRDMAGETIRKTLSSCVTSSLANGTLDLSQLTIDELKKAIDVPKELRNSQAAMIGHQMEEIRKLVSPSILFIRLHRSIQVEEFSGISIPKIYNTGAINPLQYAQQQRKRKLLWSKTNDKVTMRIDSKWKRIFLRSFFRHRPVKSVLRSPTVKMKKRRRNFGNCWE